MTTYYVGSLWHRGCDAFLTVVAKTAKDCERLLDEQAELEYERCVNEEDADEDDIDVCSSGAFPETEETLKQILSMEPEHWHDLATIGYTFI